MAVLASEALVEAVDGQFSFRLIDRVAVKGKREAVRVYELLGEGSSPDAFPAERAYERALHAYFVRDFGAALESLALLGDDPPSRMLALRCHALLAHPPSDDWNGIYVAPSK